jgi:NTE family protein
VAVCLGSGAVHGYAHIGVVRAFEKLGFRPDVITGSSVGAIVGALWAAGLRADEIEQVANDTSWHEVSGLRIPQLGIGKLDELAALIDRHVGHRDIQSLPIRFAAVATDLDSGLPVVLDRGAVGPAVAASSSVPIRYEPITINGRRLIDGALSEPVPVDAAQSIGANFTVAIDVAYRPYEEPVSGITDVGFQAFHIMINRLIDEQIKRADFVIRLDLHRIMTGPDAIPAMIRAGEEAVRERWPELSQRLQSAGVDMP